MKWLTLPLAFDNAMIMLCVLSQPMKIRTLLLRVNVASIGATDAERRTERCVGCSYSVLGCKGMAGEVLKCYVTWIFQVVIPHSALSSTQLSDYFWLWDKVSLWQRSWDIDQELEKCMAGFRITRLGRLLLRLIKGCNWRSLAGTDPHYAWPTSCWA